MCMWYLIGILAFMDTYYVSFQMEETPFVLFSDWFYGKQKPLWTYSPAINCSLAYMVLNLDFHFNVSYLYKMFCLDFLRIYLALRMIVPLLSLLIIMYQGSHYKPLQFSLILDSFLGHRTCIVLFCGLNLENIYIFI